MGFGYVFIGYLTAFLLENTVKGLGVNGAAALIGYMAMFLGLLTLSLYHSDFKVAKWSLIPMMIISALAEADFSYENLPQNTSLPKAYAERVKRKMPIGVGVGVLKF